MKWNASPDGYIERDPAPVLPPPDNESRRVILEPERDLNEGRQLSAKERPGRHSSYIDWRTRPALAAPASSRRDASLTTAGQ